MDQTGLRQGAQRGHAVVAVSMSTRQQFWQLTKTKSAADIATALRAMIARAKKTPDTIFSDRESGIVSNTRLDAMGIKVYHPGTARHAWLAESAIQQYRNRLTEGINWKTPIGDQSYEKKYNSTNKMKSLGGKTPDQLAALPADELAKLHSGRQEQRDGDVGNTAKLLTIGTPVLVQRQRERFEKRSGGHNWLPHLYEVLGVSTRKKPVMYAIRRRLKGAEPEPQSYYREELKPLTEEQAEKF